MSRIAFLSVVLASTVAAAGDKPVTAATPAAASGKTAMEAGADMGKMTCGQMMEHNAAMPAKMSELLATVADAFESHAKWADTGKDKASKAEADAVKKVAKQHREMAKEMKKTSEMMAAMKDLAPSAHDPKAMEPKMMESMKKVVDLQREMAKMLTENAANAEQMMTAMKSGSGGN